MAVVFAEGAVTRLRREFKLLLSPAEAQAMTALLRAQAAPVTTHITSVYFDRAGMPLTSRAQQTPDDCLKVRTKEYFPDLGGEDARVVIEAKRERHGLTQKQRVWVPRRELSELEANGALWTRLPLLDAGALLPVLAVTYVRDVFQHDDTWRVTVDRNVAFHPVTHAQAMGARRLTAKRLAPAVAVDKRVIVEVKHLGDSLPCWLLELRESAAKRFSKFAEGTRRLYSAHRDQVTGG